MTALRDTACKRARAGYIAKAAEREERMLIDARVDFAPLDRMCADSKAFKATCTPERRAELEAMWS